MEIGQKHADGGPVVLFIMFMHNLSLLCGKFPANVPLKSLTTRIYLRLTFSRYSRLP